MEHPRCPTVLSLQQAAQKSGSARHVAFISRPTQTMN